MAAALLLPGLIALPAYAGDDEVSFQYGHYQEGKRQLFNAKSQFNPIEVDTLQGNANIKLSERIKFAFNYTQDTWSGATPITTAPVVRQGNRLRVDNDIHSGASPLIGASAGIFDKHFNPVSLSDPANPDSTVIGSDTRLVHTLSYASPETRKQSDFKISYDWDTAAVHIGGGLSIENDYESRFGNVGGRWDFNQKLTSVSASVSYTNSHTQALLDHDAQTYYSSNNSQLDKLIHSDVDANVLIANKTDWSTHLGLTQIINKNALVNFNVGYTYSSGFMENPYKAVTFAFVDPSAVRPDGNYNGTYAVLREQRPDERNQWTENLRYVQHIDGLDAAVHVDYRFFHDDWGINAHTFDVDWVQPLSNGWTITPKFRYYSQSAADFYQPLFLTQQRLPDNGRLDASTLPSNYASDHRLSAYGTLSGGITLSKQFAKGVNFEVGFEYYSHAGALKLGGGGEGSYADFNYYVANAAMKVNLDALASTHSEHSHHTGHSTHGAHAPAGIMFDHILHKAGDVMVGYRYMYANQAGASLHGDSVARDLDIASLGCKNHPCASTPTYMTMHMHMLDLMVAPTDWLTLMLMPQFVDMSMNMREVTGADEDPNPHQHSGGHSTGGIGDTGLYAIGKLFASKGHRINLSLGISVPTGDVGIKLRDAHKLGDVFIHYGMQLGSGTWDFKPALTYTGEADKWSWGAQLSGTKRLASKNTSGFAFGDLFQATAWGGYQLNSWLAASLRGVYSVQGTVKGEFNGAHLGDGGESFDGTPRSWGGTEDATANYGGRFWDVGFGVSASVPSGDLQGNRLSFEWLQPVHDDVNGYQVERDGALSANWSYMF
ncbi:DUF3570 domain-containing protein [Crenothrix polyspora]|nr:DUF3570 domain-containing protein [Crenothrix polyspora]